jgi:ATP-dependent Lhr-like helicase
MLDRLCAAGRIVWLRLGERSDARAPVRHTPIALVPRSAARTWRAHAPRAEPDRVSDTALVVRNTLRGEGALFFDDLLDATALPADDLRAALAELVACGLAHADTFAGLRALIAPQRAHPRRRRIEDAGRWVLLRDAGEPGADGVEHIARALLRRYGVVFRKLIEREVALPPWRDLLRVYWRLEARGEIRGGRFVERFAGEQFALPEAVGLLRELRRHPREARPIASGLPIRSTSPASCSPASASLHGSAKSCCPASL